MTPDPHNTPVSPRVLVIGGGISGLAAAHRLVELSDPSEQSLSISLWEQSDRLGGVLSTKHEEGLQIEESADNFITTVPHGLNLCRRLGLDDQLTQTAPDSRRTFVVHRNRLHKLPDGFLMMAPTKMWPLAVTPLLSPWGKFRAGLEYFIPPKVDNEDESMASFGRRRLGSQVFERMIEPLISGVYGAEMEQLSVLATMPRFRDMERDHGSLIRAMRSEMRKRKRQAKKTKKTDQYNSGASPSGTPLKESGSHKGEGGARYSLFVTLREGLSKLVETLTDRLPNDCAQTNRAAKSLKRIKTDDRYIWEATAEDGTVEQFDAVILATPSGTAATLLRDIDQKSSDMVAAIEHTGTAIATVAFNREQVGHPLDGAGFVVPSVENTPILAASFSSIKYPHRAPEGKALIRIFAGGARAPEMAEMEDEKLLKTLLDGLRPLLRIEGEPYYSTVAHWPRTMPQYHVGHLDRIAQLEKQLEAFQGFELAGNAYHGVGVPACIQSGEKAAERVLEELGLWQT
jgi:protoporphyrinogen/coproporphyrinogen III oxidase